MHAQDVRSTPARVGEKSAAGPRAADVRGTNGLRPRLIGRGENEGAVVRIRRSGSFDGCHMVLEVCELKGRECAPRNRAWKRHWSIQRGEWANCRSRVCSKGSCARRATNRAGNADALITVEVMMILRDPVLVHVASLTEMVK